ncbi:MAG: Rossmann-fold NAD(P)-binding domain-containing protein [Bacteroidia bacterium]
MIVGNGLIAQTLTGIDHSNCVIFASGVSNSNETNHSMFQREIDLLLAQDRNKTLVYFSTCSITDLTLAETAYIKHKLTIENLIKKEFQNYLILRLPTLVGKTDNPHTFFNHIKNKVIANEEVTIYKNAWRYLLDADDLKIIVPALLKDKSTKNATLHAAYNNAMNVQDIVKLIDTFLKKTSKIKLLDKGSHFRFQNKVFINFLKKNNITLFTDNYNENIIRKYLG